MINEENEMVLKDSWKNEFVWIFADKVKRYGSFGLLEWLQETDFFDAPASSKYHLAIPGGLCRHSINVYARLKGMLEYEYGDKCPYTDESVAIAALLHDLCKIGTYKVGWKNQKIYDVDVVDAAEPWKVKQDAAGCFIWESVPQFEADEQFVFGHGEKSVYLIQKHMQLTDEEAVAIRFHMGAYIESEKNNASRAFSKNQLAFWLHVADSAATFIDEG